MTPPEPDNKVFCWRCHSYQQVTHDGEKATLINITFPEACLDVGACHKQWTDARDRAAQAVGQLPK